LALAWLIGLGLDTSGLDNISGNVCKVLVGDRKVIWPSALASRSYPYIRVLSAD